MVQPPVVTEASFYLAAVSLNTKKNRRRCSLLHRCKTDVRVMHGASLLSWLSVSGFITGEKEIVTAKVNPQKISPYIKSTIWSYLPCCVANCERALFTQTRVTHLSPLSKSTLIQTRVSSCIEGGGEKKNVFQELDVFTWPWKENLTLAPVVFLHLNSG